MNDRLRTALKRVNRKLAAEEWVYGLVGKITPSGAVFDVPGRAGFIYVRLRNANGAQTTPPARNDPGVPHSAGLPVRMYYEGTTLVIDSVNRRSDLATVDPPPPSGVGTHIHDTRYFTEDEHINVSAGAADAAKPIVLDAGGKLDATLIDAEDISDIVGTMVTGNTETGIAVTYQDADNTLDFVVDDEYIQDLIGAMVSGNTETNISVTYDDTGAKLNFVVATEDIQDIVGAMVSGGTETGITVTYDDTNGRLDFVVSASVDAEFVADTVGAMVTGNTETDIAVTYDDADNTLDFVVSSTLVADRISAAATDDTIADADLWGYVTGGVLVKTAWSNIKATLLTYFSTLFAVLAGTAGGQTLKGGTASGDDLTLESTNHATKGEIIVAAGSNVNIGDDPLAGNQLSIGGDSTFIGLNRYIADTTGPGLAMRKSRHATTGSHTIVQDGDELGNYTFAGSDGTAFRQGARIVARVDGTPGASDMPGRIEFMTTPDGSATAAIALVIKQDKKIGIQTASPQGPLHIHDGAGGFLFVTKTGIVGSEITLVPDGTGDVAGGCAFLGFAKGSGGTGQLISNTLTTPGAGSVTVVTGELTVKLYSTGQLVVYRSAGAETYSLSLQIVWL